MREPTGPIVGLIERQVEQQHQQIDTIIQAICPSRPNPMIANKTSSMISGMMNPAMTPASPSLLSSLLSFDLLLPTEL